MSSASALLLIAHGSRQPEANADLSHLVDRLRASRRWDVVEEAFLELAEPNITAGVAHCIAQGATQIILVPYFLSAGVHVQRDLTDICRHLSKLYPNVRFGLAEPLGRHPLLVEIVAERARAADEQLF